MSCSWRLCSVCQRRKYTCQQVENVAEHEIHKLWSGCPFHRMKAANLDPIHRTDFNCHFSIFFLRGKYLQLFRVMPTRITGHSKQAWMSSVFWRLRQTKVCVWACKDTVPFNDRPHVCTDCTKWQLPTSKICYETKQGNSILFRELKDQKLLTSHRLNNAEIWVV